MPQSTLDDLRQQLTVYTTMPNWQGSTSGEHGHSIVEHARWSEEAGCRGALIYSDNKLLDAWAAAQMIVANTERFIPLVAVNPVYMHPFSAARMVSTFGFLYHRTVDLNLVSGGFALHLRELGCRLDHEQRYERLTEYGQIVKALLAGNRPTTQKGSYYTVNAASLVPPLDPGLAPKIYVSGASEDCRRAQQNLEIKRLTYPREPGTYAGVTPLAACGLRIGIVAREDSAAAWRVAHRRFPYDPTGERSHDWASKQVQSHWHKQQSLDALANAEPNGAYWLYPFRVYRTFAPYLVGSYEEVGTAFARYRDLGVQTVLLDEVPDPDELHHALTALAHSQRDPVGAGRQAGPPSLLSPVSSGSG
jgi:alkanesulfonate monooxygenase